MNVFLFILIYFIQKYIFIHKFLPRPPCFSSNFISSTLRPPCGSDHRHLISSSSATQKNIYLFLIFFSNWLIITQYKRSYYVFIASYAEYFLLTTTTTPGGGRPVATAARSQQTAKHGLRLLLVCFFSFIRLLLEASQAIIPHNPLPNPATSTLWGPLACWMAYRKSCAALQLDKSSQHKESSKPSVFVQCTHRTASPR